MWVFASMGIFASILAILMAFIPPQSLEVGSLGFYVGFLLLSLTIMMAFPMILFQMKKPHWLKK
jgi:hypothetical protein